MLMDNVLGLVVVAVLLICFNALGNALSAAFDSIGDVVRALCDVWRNRRN